MSDDELDAAFAALADRTRRAIILRLSGGAASVMELAEPFAMSQPAISKHLKVLERAGLIARTRDAQRRPCRLLPERLREVTEWLGTYREFWEHAYGQLDVLLEELQTEARGGAREPSAEARDTARAPKKEKPRDRKKARDRRPAR